MRKRVCIIAIVLVLALAICALGACSAKTYSINIGEIANGTVTASVQLAEEGAEVTLTVNADAGYSLDYLKVSGEAVTVTDGIASFKMPASDVSIEAAFKKVQYVITVAEAAHGSVKANVEAANLGDKIELSVDSDWGYEVESIAVNGEAISAVDGAYSFNMPAKDVNVSASFVKVSDIVTDAAPENAISLSAEAFAGGKAEAKYVLSYEEDCVKLVAYVKDSVVLPIDGIGAYLGTKAYSNGGLTAVNKGIELKVGGAKLYVVQDGSYVEAEASVNAKISPWAEGDAIIGYCGTVSVPYADLGVTKDAIEGNLTVLVSLSNDDKGVLPKTVIYGGGSVDNADTYPVLNADGTLSDSDYKYGAGQLGQGDTSIKNGPYWDLSKDYGKDSENYADRIAILNGHDGDDNNLTFYRVSGKTLWAKATIKLTGISNIEERYGKFGLMLYNGSVQTGVFFYVDAYVGNGVDVTLNNVNGTALGYNDGNNGWGNSWVTIGGTGGSFNLETKTIDLGLMAYDGSVYMFLGDKLVGSVRYEVGDDAVIGFKSFGYNLEVTNYSIVDEVSEDRLVELGIKLADAVLDGVANEEIWTEKVLDRTYSFGKREKEGSYYDLAAVKGSDGVYFLATIYHKQALTEVAQQSGSEWWHWLNLEFRFGDKDGDAYQRALYFENGKLKAFGGIVVGDYVTEAPNEEHSLNKTVVEFYAPYTEFPGYDKDSEEVRLQVWGWVAETGWTEIFERNAYITSEGLIIRRNIRVNSPVEVTVNKTAVKGDNVDFTLSVEEGVTIGLVVVDGNEVSPDANGVYSFVMPNKDVEIVVVTEKETLDVLFLGDSYMEFWTRSGFEAQTSAIKSKKNIGVGGTQINYWTERANVLSLMYNPQKLVFHIGVNDIDDGDTTAEVAYARFQTMMGAYREVFPDAEIYWVSLVHNTMFASKCGEYDKMNTSVQEYVSTHEKVNYIDVTNVMVDSDGNTRVNMSYDGLHFNTEYGYPIWAKQILEGIGYGETRVEGATLGDSEGLYAYSNGWSFSEDGEIASSDGAGEQAIWAKDMPYTTGDFLYTVDVYTSGKTQTDAYTKIGVALRNNNRTIFGYIDLADDGNHLWSNIVCRGNGIAESGSLAQGDWNWNWQGSGGNASARIDEGYVTLGIARMGSNIYFLVNGEIVATHTAISGAEEGYVAGVLAFGRNMNAKNSKLKIPTESVTMLDLLGLTPNDAVLDGKADEDIWTEEVLGNTLSVGKRGEGSYYNIAAVKGSDGVYFLATIYHKQSLEEVAQGDGNGWWTWLNLEYRFGNNASQQAIYFENGVVKAINGVAVGSYVTTEPDEKSELRKTTVEFFAPYSYFSGYSADSAEIGLTISGWVAETGWCSIYQYPTISEHGLRFAHKITVAGANIDVPETARKGDKISFSLDLEEGLILEGITVNQEPLTAEEGIYSFIMPDKDVAIVISIDGRRHVTIAEGSQDKLSVSNTDPDQGNTIEFTGIGANAIAKLIVNDVEVLPNEEGKYLYKVGADDIVASAEFKIVTDGIEIDGFLEESYGEPQGFNVTMNRDVTLYAKKTYHGLVLYLIAHTNTNVTDASDWYQNHNFEFYLNGNTKDQRYVNSRGWTNGVTAFYQNAILLEEGAHAGQYEHRYEVFVEGNYEDDVQLNYAFKAPGEGTSYEGHGAGASDWWCPTIGGANKGLYVPISKSKDAFSSNLFITEKGLRAVAQPTAQFGTIDGDLSEFKGKAAVEHLKNDGDKADFTFTGYVADDGYYLGITILQKEVSAETTDWWLNDNLEIYLFSIGTGFSIVGDKLFTHGPAQGAMVRTELTEGEYKYKTVIELFINYDNPGDAAYFRIGSNGNGFGGWKTFAWDGADRFKVTKDGLTFVQEGYDGHALSADGVALDGVLDEDFWKDVTVWDNKGCSSYSGNGVYAKVQAKKGAAGIYLAVTMYHHKAATEQLRTDGDENQWWVYLNIEFKFVVNGNWEDGNSYQRASSVHGESINCASNFATAENTDTEAIEGTEDTLANYEYKTVFEIFSPYEWGVADVFGIDADIPLYIACVAETGWNWLINFGEDATAPTVVTNDGYIRK